MFDYMTHKERIEQDMNRRRFLQTTPAALLCSSLSMRPLRAQILGHVAAISEEHFPSRLHQFVWRNWELANLDRMATVVGATPEQLGEVAASIGLPPKPRLSEDQLRRIYITVIRQNWHLLPEEQIIQLLGWDERRYRFTLKEDDFLAFKLGNVKPICAPLVYSSPTEADRRRAHEIRHLLQQWFGDRLLELGEERFAFVSEFNKRATLSKTSLHKANPDQQEIWPTRLLYSYFALYGDPLMEGNAAGLPDGYLERAAERGINGIWIQAVLNTLAPSKAFPEFGAGSQTRLANLHALTELLDKYGMKLYLYLNEPRAMPDEFFAQHPGIRGTKYQDLYSMCTSAPVVRDWLRSTLSHVFHHAPKLGGIFSITMSENHTNCFSHGGAWGDRYPVATHCPRCSKRTGAEVLSELITTFRDGIREQSKAAQIITWDWGWGSPIAADLIPRLPKDTTFMSISEWSTPVFRGGIHTSVGEYSMSVVGPGPRALTNWNLAKQAGLKTMAKTQFNNTWEISAVPYIPVLPLVLEHCERLSSAGIDGLLESWTCGGYPSPNLSGASAYAFRPHPGRDEILKDEAARLFGTDAAPKAVAAWQKFSEAFLEFPYGVAVYTIPTQHGPANLLRLHATHLKAGMILFPYDDYKTWSGAYPPEVAESQFRKLAAKWRDGLALLEAAAEACPPQKRRLVERELAIARTCQSHFQSTANQIEFYRLRDSVKAATIGADNKTTARMLELVHDEMELSKRQYFVARGESLIAYEASNHYYYTPLDLVEKMLNCHDVEHALGRAQA